MRKLLRKIIEILDGTPAEYGKRQSGQSLVEIAFITPLLIILVAGVVEIGVLASNYLSLIEVTRVGARRGTVLTGDNSPLSWNNAASLVPRTRWNNDPWQDPLDGGYVAFTAFPPAADEGTRLAYRGAASLADPCSAISEASFGFYNLITCTMLRSLDPLPFRGGIAPDSDPSLPPQDRFYPDDIIVSAFALQAIRNPEDIDFAANFMPGVPTGNRVHVVGRYPTNANECTVDTSDNIIDPPPERDPFDFIENGYYNCWDVGDGTCGAEPVYIELGAAQGFMDVAPDGTQLREYQRGFAWFGQHRVEVDDFNPIPVNCLGSQWSIERVEQLMNLPSFGLDADQREFLPSAGMVLVEMYWRHDLFLAFPLFSPIYDMLGPRTTISAWAAFPVPAAEPNIDFTPPTP